MSGMGILGPLLPLAMLASLVVVALQRRAAKKKRLAGKPGPNTSRT